MSTLNSPVPINDPVFVPGIANRLIVEKDGAFSAFAIESATTQWMVDEEDITHSEAEGWQSTISGVKRLNLTNLTFVYDLENDPVLAPFEFIPGMLVRIHIVLDANPWPDKPSPAYTREWTGLFRMGPFEFPIGPKNPAVRVTTSAKSFGKMTVPGEA